MAHITLHHAADLIGVKMFHKQTNVYEIRLSLYCVLCTFMTYFTYI